MYNYKKELHKPPMTGVLACVLFSLAMTHRASADCEPQELAKLIAPDYASGDYFGNAVAIDGETLVVGALLDNVDGHGLDSGSARVFVRTNGIWTQQATLFAADGTSHDRFGYAVAIRGDTIVVGAIWESVSNVSQAGAAYVFTRTDGIWTQTAKLVSLGPLPQGHFGSSLALSENRLLVGAPREQVGGENYVGLVHSFHKNGNAWVYHNPIAANDSDTEYFVGLSCALSGENTTVIGAPGAYSVGQTRGGAAYVFTYPGTVINPNYWQQGAKLIASDSASQDFFGVSVAVSEDTAIVGARNDDHGTVPNAGSAYVFVRNDNVWTQQAKLVPSIFNNEMWFGNVVAVSGDIAIVGAPQASVPNAAWAGAVYVFSREGEIWTEQAKIMSSDFDASDQFGCAIALQDTSILVGAYDDDHPPQFHQGSAYLIDISDCFEDADSDGDGIVDTDDICPMNPGDLPVDCTGRPLRDANLDCLVTTDDVPLIAAELLSLVDLPSGCNGFLRDVNGDGEVNGSDVQQIVDEILIGQ